MARAPLAASVVVTFSVSAAACKPTMPANPPPLENSGWGPGIEAPAPTPEAPAGEVPLAPAPGEEGEEGGAPQELPEASEGAVVHRRDDGTCWEHPDVECPPPDSGMTCNPPPPRQVRCDEAEK